MQTLQDTIEERDEQIKKIEKEIFLIEAQKKKLDKMYEIKNEYNQEKQKREDLEMQLEEFNELDSKCRQQAEYIRMINSENAKMKDDCA
jgi:chromosome segregation ATPase